MVSAKKINDKKTMLKDKILVLGANGKIGRYLCLTLREVYGQSNVIATDISPAHDSNFMPFEILDSTDAIKLEYIVQRYKITHIYNLSAILSTKGEINPLETWRVNMSCFFNVLEIARCFKLKQVFFPSSISVFGSNTPRNNTPQDTIRTPETAYGMSKVAGENWSSYYFKRYGLDVRSIRYPCVIGNFEKFNDGVTDFASEMFLKASEDAAYTCYISPTTRLPMVYLDDVINASLRLMDAPIEKISVRSSYNISGFSATPDELCAEIKKTHPNFKVIYKTDLRQYVADSWPETVDDSQAKKDWGWKSQFNIEKTSEKMLGLVVR